MRWLFLRSGPLGERAKSGRKCFGSLELHEEWLDWERPGGESRRSRFEHRAQHCTSRFWLPVSREDLALYKGGFNRTRPRECRHNRPKLARNRLCSICRSDRAKGKHKTDVGLHVLWIQFERPLEAVDRV